MKTMKTTSISNANNLKDQQRLKQFFSNEADFVKSPLFILQLKRVT